MTDYPDTSFLCALYREQDTSPAADAYWQERISPLPFTSLLEFEFLQAIRFQAFLHGQDRKKGYPAHEAETMIAAWESDIASGVLHRVPYDVEAVNRLAISLSARHTETGGHRSLDILHIATAVHLGAKHFLTFDARQKRLAKACGLKTPF